MLRPPRIAATIARSVAASGDQAALASAEGGSADLSAATMYRVPTQTSMDGNTVELSQEQTAFAENAVQYQTTLSFLNGRISQITRALKGE